MTLIQTMKSQVKAFKIAALLKAASRSNFGLSEYPPERSFSNIPEILGTIKDRFFDPYGDTSGSGSAMDAIRTAAAYIGSDQQDQDKSRAKINLGSASDFYDEDKLAGIMSTDAAKDII